VTLGGSLASNVHGRGLRFPPIISDVESFLLVDSSGKLLTCSRRENPGPFRLAIGGYGLFGIIAQVTLRLVPRKKVQRVVKLLPLGELLAELEPALREGSEYGDFKHATHLETQAAEHPGVFVYYGPVPQDTPLTKNTSSYPDKSGPSSTS
jgi:FAD/FMN-containing dehydrogenase